MNKIFVFVGALGVCSACAANPPVKKPLDQQTFEAAKARCGLAEASFFSGGFGLTLPSGQDSPSATQKAKLDCMDRELTGFEYHVVTETRPPQ